MRLVAICTSSGIGSVALSEAGRVVAKRSFASGMIHGRALLPALADLLGERGWSPKGIEAVAVDVGPGSYTGCRVGVMAAKILARETGARLVGVPSLAAIAWGLRAGSAGGRVAVALDARRSRVYGGLYRVDGGSAASLRGPEVAPARGWGAEVGAQGPGILWAGDALAAYPDAFPATPRAPAERWAPDASAVAALGGERLSRGEGDDPYRLEPLYLEPTEAERKLGRGEEP